MFCKNHFQAQGRTPYINESNIIMYIIYRKKSTVGKNPITKHLQAVVKIFNVIRSVEIVKSTSGHFELYIFITLVLLPIYFVYSSVYRTFTRFIGQCPV